MFLDCGNAVDRVIYLFGEYDREEMEWMASKVRDSRETLFYDIGANVGIYSVILPTMIPGLVTHSFEPDLRNLVFLQANIVINNLEQRVSVWDVAVGDEAGTVQFMEFRGGDLFNTGKSKVVGEPCEHAQSKAMRKIALDDHCQVSGQTILIKIDVEGYEFEVLSGMRRTLRENDCVLMVEIFDENVGRCDSLMETLGYRRTESFGLDNWAYEKSEKLEMSPV